jgi:hypothetical protein
LCHGMRMKSSCRCGTTGDSPAPFTPRRVAKSPAVSGDLAMSQECLLRETDGFNFRRGERMRGLEVLQEAGLEQHVVAVELQEAPLP